MKVRARAPHFMIIPRTEVVVSEGGERIASHVLEPGEYVIGREAGCEIVAAVEGVSRRHAKLTVNYADMLIEDLASANGTFVNDRPVGEAVRLWPGQTIRVGDATITTRRLRSEDGGESILPITAELRKRLPAALLKEERYAIHSLVAQGGMGAILDARDQTIRRTVAMKVMLDPRFEDDMVRFIEEAQVTGQLEHPNIVPIYELGVDAHEQVFYTMKFVRGITLKKVLDLLAAGSAGTIAKYPLAALLTVFQKVCDAVAFAHSRGVIHRDLKPENVMIGDFGEVLVMDWGLAKVGATSQSCGGGEAGLGSPAYVLSARCDSGEAGATMAGMILGTPSFMAPEQAEGRIADLDARTDIFALGGILYSILTLQVPFTGATVEEILAKVVSGRITPPAKLIGLTQRRKGAKEEKEPDVAAPSFAPLRLCVKHLPGSRVPDSLSAVAMKALATQPGDRYQSVPALQKDIEAYQGGFATGAERSGAGKQLVLLVKRHKAVSTAAVALIFLSAAFTAKVLAERNRAERSLAELRGTAPTFEAQSRALLAEGNLDVALAKIGYAVTLAPESADYRLARAHLFQSTQKLSAAADEYRRVLSLRPDDAAAKSNLDLCARLLAENGGAAELQLRIQGKLLDALVAQHRALEASPLSKVLKRGNQTAEATIRARLASYTAQKGWNEERIRSRGAGFTVDLGDLQLGDLSVLRDLPIVGLDLRMTSVSDLRAIAGLPLFRLSVAQARVSDLSPLRGMKLKELSIYNNSVQDLAPLAGMPLEMLSAYGTQIADLTPLRGAPLDFLKIDNTKVRDLSPLAGMPLIHLSLKALPITDLIPLRGMPLREIYLHGTWAVRDFSPLAGCPTLEKISLPWDISDIAFLATLPKLQQVELHEGNQPDIWIPARVFLAKHGSDVPEINAARAALATAGVKDLPIRRTVAVSDHQLDLDLKETTLTDLTALRGLSIRKLNLAVTGVRDLEPLRGMPIQELELRNTKVRDLEPLRGMPLRKLGLSFLNVNSLEPLRGMPLTGLYLRASSVRDVGILADFPDLEEIELPEEKAINIERLRTLPKLRYLSTHWDPVTNHPAQTAAQFWAEYDAKK